MEWMFVPALAAFPEFADRWHNLNACLHDSHPLLDYRFVGELLRHFGNDDVTLAIGGEPSKPDALILLETTRRGIWQTFAPSQCQLAPALISPQCATNLNTLIETLPGRAIAIDFLSQDPFYSPLKDIATQSKSWQTQQHAITTSINLDDGWQAYWESRSRNLRKKIRHIENRMRSNGIALKSSITSEASKIPAAVEAYGNLESQGWKGVAGTAVNAENKQASFYNQIISNYAASGCAAIYELHHDTRLVSSRLTINNQQMMVILKTTFDETYAPYGVGWALLLRILRQAASEPRKRTIEFYTNASEEQIAWSTHQRVIFHATLYRNSFERLGLTTIKKGTAAFRSALSQSKEKIRFNKDKGTPSRRARASP